MSDVQLRNDIVKGCLIHESSYIDDSAKIGEGTRLWHFSHIMSGAEIGSNCSIGQNVVVMSGAKLGNGCKVQNNVSIYAGVECEDNVFLGPSCVFTNVINPRSAISRKHEYRTTHVKKGSTIGANATIVCGVTLGSYCFVGAGAVVTADVPDYALVYGTPARLQGWLCRCGVKLTFPDAKSRTSCKSCGSWYSISGNLVSAD